jgi:hypothetical protein
MEKLHGPDFVPQNTAGPDQQDFVIRTALPLH